MSISVYQHSSSAIRALSLALALTVNALAALVFVHGPAVGVGKPIASTAASALAPRIDLGCLRGVEIRAPRRIAAIAAEIR